MLPLKNVETNLSNIDSNVDSNDTE